ncbi:helix-turn-helix domain-containing protein [Brevibacillus formosus]|uniref:winged helix-turn-helix transcriptional regulator n=1 Tax=Brevibacillus TaxID=55080 RepID=UPI000D1006D7|nr:MULTISPECIES: helix-turn-helix domain-containing protein [Brevibacillus]MBG9941080.1 MarR family transcriptional regulator [Brevibacillus formosus]MBW5470952.1 MarR family transcriptional regulator [Brevibacillus formosus]MED1945901.1 helix-turn-helix domain-containing protein [Brevibacillus formosus]MED2001719.1 helix-turn-helix domain-containing protein [Brevibacillus formosus]MED2085820.1 helix-turn-helix domain-containing protein [Brevibacillus formosus]
MKKKPAMRYLLNGKEYPCPIELAVSVFAGRWKVSIICQLFKGKKRYGELKKNIIGVNHKMLAEQLRELEEAGIVKREVYPVVPPKVEYELTELGQGLGPVIEYLREWGEHFQTEEPEESLSTAHGS